MTRGPASRAGALLELLRPVVDEVLVAVDDRADPAVYGAVSPAADRVVRYRYSGVVDRPLAWLHSACSSDWVLTVDDDEIPGRALLDSLRELVSATDVTHYWLPRRWLYPDRSHYLAAYPWQPDYQLRLVLNDPRLLAFPDELHTPVAVVGPGRYLDAPLYHAVALVATFEQRLERACCYEAASAGRRIAGRPLNHLFYLPELASPETSARVPAEDAALVGAVLDASERREAADPEAFEAVPDPALERLWAGRRLGEAAYRARLTALDPPPTLLAGEVRPFTVRVENLGDDTWPWGRRVSPEIRVAHRWRDGGGALVVRDGLRTPLPVDLPPGGAETLLAAVQAPTEPGRYLLELDLVHEHVRWFGCEATCEVEVTTQPHVGVIGGDEAAIGAVLARLAEEAPGVEPVVVGRRLDYLVAGLPAGRAAAPLLLLRAAALGAAARSATVPVPAAGRAFLAELRSLDALVVGDASAPVRGAAALAARAAGVPVVLVDGAGDPGRLAGRLLLAAARRAATARLGELGAVESRERRSPPAELPEWEFVPDGWRRERRDARVTGWNVDAVAQAVRAKWPSFLRAVAGNGPLGIYHEVATGDEVGADDVDAQGLALAWAHVLGLAPRSERVSVLDWGGAAGHHYVLARALLPGLQLDYHVRELPRLAELGRELLPDVKFYDDDACLEAAYDVVLASASLQYVEEWGSLLDRLARASRHLLYVTRVPLAERSASFVVLQRAHRYGYATEYLGWVLNREELLARPAAAGLRLVREFLLEARFSAAGAPEQPVGHRGFMWRRAG